MEFLPKNKLLDFNEDTFGAVRKEFGLDKPERMKEALDLLEEWLKKQQHFVKKDFSRDYLERMLIGAKGSVERTKERLERGCTLKTLMPHFFEDFDIKNDFTFHGKLSIAMLPKLIKNHERIFLTGDIGPGLTQRVSMDGYRYCAMLCEYLRMHAYSNGFHIIIDYRCPYLTEILANFSLLDMRQLAVILIEGYGVRVKGIHLITDSKFMSILLTIAKQVVPKKLSSRIVHENVESLHKAIDKDLLPVEFGGKERSLKELNANWIETMSSKEFRDYWKEMITAGTDETRRRSAKFNEQYMGMPGSFRALSVD